MCQSSGVVVAEVAQQYGMVLTPSAARADFSAGASSLAKSLEHVFTMCLCRRTLLHEHINAKWTYIAIQELISSYVDQCFSELDS